MPKLKVLSGKDIMRISFLFGFEIISQKGSHIKLQRTTKDNTKQSVTVPNHHELDKGTLKSIIRQLSEYIFIDELNKHFYTD